MKLQQVIDREYARIRSYDCESPFLHWNIHTKKFSFSLISVYTYNILTFPQRWILLLVEPSLLVDPNTFLSQQGIPIVEPLSNARDRLCNLRIRRVSKVFQVNRIVTSDKLEVSTNLPPSTSESWPGENLTEGPRKCIQRIEENKTRWEIPVCYNRKKTELSVAWTPGVLHCSLAARDRFAPSRFLARLLPGSTSQHVSFSHPRPIGRSFNVSYQPARSSHYTIPPTWSATSTRIPISYHNTCVYSSISISLLGPLLAPYSFTSIRVHPSLV